MRSPSRHIVPVVVLVAVLIRTGAAEAASDVTVQATAAASTLDIDGEGSASTHVVKIADVQLTSDASGGLTVTVSASSIGRVGGRPIAVQVLLVPDGASPPTASEFTTPAGATHTFSTSSAGTVHRDLYIKYTPAALQDPGEYTASIDLNVADN